MTNPPAGWYTDPSQRHELRYWDGATWTEHVSDGGENAVDAPVAATPTAPSADAAGPADPAALADRRDVLEKAVGEWCGQLIDLGGRNTLLYFRELKVGTLDLTGADPAALESLFDGRSIRLSRLFHDPEALTSAARRCRAVRAKAKENYEERGLRTLSIGVGMASWTNPRGTATPAAPVLLRSLTLSPRAGGEDDFEVALTDDWEVNPTLLHMLGSEHSVTLDADTLLAAGVDEAGHLAPTPVFERLTQAAAEVAGWAIAARIVVANLSYVKMPMVVDLEASIDVLAAHPLISALAGSAKARDDLRTTQVGLGEEIDESLPDHQEPRDEFLVLDADASQCRVVNLAVRGANLVVQGPPGTGKSQTIANLIATLVARGRSVLFVAEKRAAIDAVLGRLRGRSLDDLVLDLHEGTGSRKRLAADLGRTLQAMSTIAAPNVAAMQSELSTRRDELNRHVSALHNLRSPWSVSVFDLQSTLLGVPSEAHTEQLVPSPGLESLNAAALTAARDELAEWIGLDGPGIRSRLRPWSAAAGQIVSGEQVQQAQQLVAQLRSHRVPIADAQLGSVITNCGLRHPGSIDECIGLIQFLSGVNGALTAFAPGVYSAGLDALIDGLAPAAKGPIARAWHSMFDGKYKQAKRDAAALALASGPKKPADLLTGLEHVRGQRALWAQHAVDGGLPRLPPDLHAVTESFQQLHTELTVLGAWLGGAALTNLDFPTLSAGLEALAADDATLVRLPRVHELHSALFARDLGEVVDDIAGRGLSVDLARECLTYAWAASILKRIAATDPLVGAFDGINHDRVVREFVARDEEQLIANVQRVRREVAEAAVAARNDAPNQSDVLEKNARLKRRQASVRDLLQMAPDVLLAVRPCWVMSPLVVSQLLPSDRTYFDVVVFDEASQIRPADAIPALARARQAVVAGDSKQLPPTTFFDVTATASDDEESSDGTADAAAETPWTQDMDSILDALAALLPANQGSTTLDWHYRSRDERLIAFSNAQPELYDWSLTTFPGAQGEGCLRHVLVPHRPGIGGGTESSTEEVAAVVSLVQEHATTRPHESLGVIAMGIKHADRITESLRLARGNDPALDDFLDEGKEEPFFVKNLERVQGDERDAIILTVGYPKTPDGRMQYRFGPINQEGGERRLNVAITRSRIRMTTVSAFTPEDMDDSSLKAVGAQMLKRYLSYARSGGTDLGSRAMAKPALNGFENDVKRRLTTAGIPLETQYGVAGFWIDFAAKHPTQPGRMVLAIEADGATYHSSNTARERDRLRQAHLERLGWRFHRIWSTDWFNHTDREVQRVVDAYQAAVAAADAPPAHPPASTPIAAAPVTAPVAAPAVPAGPLRSDTRPGVEPGKPIDDYTDAELDALCRWIESDTLLRTDAELLEEMMRELGFHRRGSKIVTRLTATIQRKTQG